MKIYKLTKEELNNFDYIPEQVCNCKDDTVHYTWDDLMNLAKGNKKVAFILYRDCVSRNSCVYPEVYLNNSLCCNEIFRDSNGNYHVNPMRDFNLVLEE